MEDQVEMLTRSRTPAVAGTEVQKVMAGLPVQVQEQRNALLDSVAQDQEDPLPPGESRTFAGFERILSWVAYGAIVVVAALIMWAVGLNIVRYTVQR